VTAPDSYIALNRGIQLCGIHVTPARQLHDAPSNSRTAPAVIVGSGNHGEVQRVGERDYIRARPLNHPDSLGRTVAEFNCVETRESLQLVVRQLGEIARNREDQHGDRSRYRHCGVAFRIVPVSLWIECKRRVDADGDDVFVLIPRLERGQEHRCISSTRRVSSDTSLRSDKALVITDVCNVETGCVMPCAVALRREPVGAVPRRVRMAVKIDYDLVGVVHHDTRHRSRQNSAASIHDHNGRQCRYERSNLTKQRRAPGTCPNNAPRDHQ